MAKLPLRLTEDLWKWNAGDAQALEQVMQNAYGMLRKLAHAKFANHRPSDTIQPTVLIHEAYIRILSKDITIENSNHFFWLFGQLMRFILIDHIKAKNRLKRGGSQSKPVEDPDQIFQDPAKGLTADQLVDLDGALSRLATLDRRQSNILEMYYFCGFKIQTIAEVLDVSSATVKRDLQMGRAWLASHLTQ